MFSGFVASCAMAGPLRRINAMVPVPYHCGRTTSQCAAQGQSVDLQSPKAQLLHSHSHTTEAQTKQDLTVQSETYYINTVDLLTLHTGSHGKLNACRRRANGSASSSASGPANGPAGGLRDGSNAADAA